MKDEPDCKAKDCKEKAVSLSSYCWLHIPDKAAYKSALVDKLNREKNAREFNLRKVELQDVELMNVDFHGANLVQADLSGSNVFYNNFTGADLMGSNLSRCDFTGSTFTGADLTQSNLTRSRLWHSDASDAILTEADLSEADLWQSRLYNVRLWRTELVRARFLTRQNFSRKGRNFLSSEKIDEKTHLSAEDAYRELKRYFLTHGRYNDASWASFKEKTMEKTRLWHEKKLAFFPVALMGLLCGYGERPHRIILSSTSIIFLYGLIFFMVKAVRSPLDEGVLLSFWDYIYYSIVTFTTLGYGDIIPKAEPAYRMLAVSEAFIGAFMIGLFVFTLARKYSAR